MLQKVVEQMYKRAKTAGVHFASAKTLFKNSAILSSAFLSAWVLGQPGSSSALLEGVVSTLDHVKLIIHCHFFPHLLKFC